MASLKRLLCCSLILATEAIFCSGSFARDQTADLKPKANRIDLGSCDAGRQRGRGNSSGRRIRANN